MSDQNEPLLDAITAILPPLLNAIESLGMAGRYLHPPNLAELATQLGDLDAPVRAALDEFRNAPWPENLLGFKQRIEAAGDAVCRAAEGLRASVGKPDGVFQAYRALRFHTRATEALYPLAAMLPPVSQFYLEADARNDTDLLAKLAAANAEREDVGVMHADNDKGSRGGFSMYVPEYYDPKHIYPVVMALHGGTGHGRYFLWTWLREARSRGAIVISPSSRGDTWALMGTDIDSENIDAMLERVCARWNVDRTRVLLTGMSDGGTFSYVSGLRDNAPYTHLAPISAAFHPMILQAAGDGRIKDLPVYLTHGALDWMFPVDIAQTANKALREAGADVVYREIADLSHTYPREENTRIMDWFLSNG
ncbi:MAG TPA: phospholipase [Sneathiellales bacterium]|nr:phospholipase [Sneathiellales bacterium]